MEADLSFGHWLQLRRKTLDLTQAELAQRVGYARVTIHKIETDQLRPSRQIAEKLADELTIAPTERQAFLRFARDDSRAGPSLVLLPERVPARRSSPRRHNLPVLLTRFIGREQEVRDGCALLRGDVRLLTLTGAGGIGKTRLALEVAAAMVETCPDGVWFVDLAPLADPDLIRPAIATALGVHGNPSQTLAAVRGRNLLLVLDNCEHVIDACAQLIEQILHAAPDVRILATSRQALRIAGEVIRPVPPLGLPPHDTVPTVDQLQRCEAVRLFVERALAVQPHFAVTTQNAKALAQICQRVDGMPLALELAAARVGVLSVDQIAARLHDRFRLLTGGSRTALPRQQTLQATIDWSYDLLSRRDRVLFERLAVFAGGWTLEAGEAVCAGEEIDRAEILDGLAALIDQSLVVVAVHGEQRRYSLLETLRHYAWERLVESGKASEARERHFAWYLGLAEQSDPQRPGTDQHPGLTQLEAEHDNLRSAMEWSLENDPERGQRLAGCLAEFWRRSGHHGEGHRWLTAVLATGYASSSQVGSRARVLLGVGQLAADRGEPGPDQVTLAKESVRLFRDAGDQLGLVKALQHLGRCMLESMGEAEQVHPLLAESLRVAQTLGDQHGIGFALANLAYLAWWQGNHGQALELFEQAVAHIRASGDALFTGLVLGSLGWYTLLDGDRDRARRFKEESLDILRSLEAKEAVGLGLLGLAYVVRQDGDGARLRAVLEEGGSLLRETGSPGLYDWLSFVGQLHVARGEYARGVRFLAAGDSDGPRAGSLRALLYQMPRDEREACLATARSALGEAAFHAAWAEGKTMATDQAIAAALAEPETDPLVSASSGRPVRRDSI
jgi:predicted ATPase/transcriptional regulator with XRE-family HTH domain